VGLRHPHDPLAQGGSGARGDYDARKLFGVREPQRRHTCGRTGPRVILLRSSLPGGLEGPAPRGGRLWDHSPMFRAPSTATEERGLQIVQAYQLVTRLRLALVVPGRLRDTGRMFHRPGCTWRGFNLRLASDAYNRTAVLFTLKRELPNDSTADGEGLTLIRRRYLGERHPRPMSSAAMGAGRNCPMGRARAAVLIFDRAVLHCAIGAPLEKTQMAAHAPLVFSKAPPSMAHAVYWAFQWRNSSYRCGTGDFNGANPKFGRFLRHWCAIEFWSMAQLSAGPF
jgi:hypothetical protein